MSWPIKMTSVLPGFVNTVGEKNLNLYTHNLIWSAISLGPLPNLHSLQLLDYFEANQKFHYISKSKRNVTGVPFKMILTYFMVFHHTHTPRAVSHLKKVLSAKLFTFVPFMAQTSLSVLYINYQNSLATTAWYIFSRK